MKSHLECIAYLMPINVLIVHCPKTIHENEYKHILMIKILVMVHTYKTKQE